jgi:uncharacterized protein YacL (UPF0231 family)
MLRFHRDSEGELRAQADHGRDLLAQWLESDVQESAVLGRKVIAAIDKVASGKLDDWERTGNAYTLTLASGGASIEPDFEDAEPLELPLAELREAVARWVEFLESEEH